MSRLPIGSTVAWKLTPDLGIAATGQLLRFVKIIDGGEPMDATWPSDDTFNTYAEVLVDGQKLHIHPTKLHRVALPLSADELAELESRLKPWDADSPLASLVRRALAELHELRSFDHTKGGTCPICQAEWHAPDLVQAQAGCPGRDHRNHVTLVCEGSCCTTCGGPIDEEDGCRC